MLSLIHKGGSVAKPADASASATRVKPMLVQLRLYPDMIEEIDARAEKHSGETTPPAVATCLDRRSHRRKAGARRATDLTGVRITR